MGCVDSKYLKCYWLCKIKDNPYHSMIFQYYCKINHIDIMSIVGKDVVLWCSRSDIKRIRNLCGRIERIRH